MQKLTNCAHCGVAMAPPKANPSFCSAGCALVGQVPVDRAGNFPVNRWLLIGLGVMLLYFNQLLLWSAVAWQSHHGEFQVSGKFIAAEVVAALLVWAAQVFAIVIARVKTAKDFLFAALALGILISSWRNSPPSGAILAAGNFVFLIWNGRGLLRRGARTAGKTGS